MLCIACFVLLASLCASCVLWGDFSCRRPCLNLVVLAKCCSWRPCLLRLAALRLATSQARSLPGSPLCGSLPVRLAALRLATRLAALRLATSQACCFAARYQSGLLLCGSLPVRLAALRLATRLAALRLATSQACCFAARYQSGLLLCGSRLDGRIRPSFAARSKPGNTQMQTTGASPPSR